MRAETDEESVTLGMIPIYLFNASPWGSLTKGYRLLNPLSQREMREKNPYNIQRWRALLSSCIIHASWSLSTANAKNPANMCTHIQRGEDVLLHVKLQLCCLIYTAADLQADTFLKNIPNNWGSMLHCSFVITYTLYNSGKNLLIITQYHLINRI